MMKSWADHCSSDEDTDDNYSVDSVESEVKEEAQSLDEAFEEKAQINEPTPQARTYDFPSQPPFTAFVGNLSFHIKEPSQLQQALADVVFERLGERVNVLGGRISFDRNSQKHRGFGYVELETLDELKIVMKLNDDDGAMLAGRKIQVDTANHQTNQRNNNNYNNRRGGGRGDNNNNNNNNRGSFQRAPNEKIDGSKFRGGKYNNQNSFRNKNNNNNKDTKDEAPRQRPSLKLAPRSKPVDERRSSSSDIFGGAKARDEQAWEKQKLGATEDKKKILKKPDNNNNNNNKSQGGRSGGRGGNKGGRGGNRNNGGRGNDNNNNNNNNNNKKNNNRRNSQNEKKKEEKPAPKPAATKPADPPPPAEKAAPKNKFALLMDDSDSD
eukprot:CAMPEP_0116130608 /NCGR_PEP_ID=MMETSP0329-20121206/8572_1 /TAXON_ID=697910 /ORGANISM="Pseudo-nitzschia arenysensis, Strain B593" /LENGTH=380 /DNA_ID=CAMNT_0003625001 /DNA_START=192 /DNA_END=1334 /DNA_ORIENTATION=-